jgi:hypothetical protein
MCDDNEDVDRDSLGSQSTVAPKRRRGRPRVSDHEKVDILRDYYVLMGAVRGEKLRTKGKLRSKKEASRLLYSLAWIGRDPLKAGTSGKNHRCEVEILNRRWHFRRSEKGPIYVRRLVQGPKILEARYHEAARFAKGNPDVKLAWDNMVRDLIGLPRVPPPRPLPSALYPNALARVW